MDENLQQFEADMDRLVTLTYSSVPQEFSEQLSALTFIDGLQDLDR